MTRALSGAKAIAWNGSGSRQRSHPQKRGVRGNAAGGDMGLAAAFIRMSLYKF